jgi:hypothetical protein
MLASENTSSSSKILNVLYLGDVPVESSHHGSALLYRLFEQYPANSLLVMESNLASSQPARRLPGITCSTAWQPARRWLHTLMDLLSTKIETKPVYQCLKPLM